MNKVPRRLIIADDHAVVRTGMQLILEETDDLTIASECSTGEDLIDLLGESEFDLVLLDIHMPGKDSVQVLKEIRKERPSLPVVIFTMNNEEGFMTRMFQNGAAAFISKDLPPENIIEILRKVLDQKRYLTDEQAKIIASLAIDPQQNSDGTRSLTPREYQVLREIAMGSSNAEIAAKFGLSKNTVGNHRMNILRKLNLKNNSDLTRYAYRSGIIE